jgi:hypothetical protein
MTQTTSERAGLISQTQADFAMRCIQPGRYIGADGVPSVWPYEACHHREILQAPEPADWEVQPGPARAAGRGTAGV